MKNKIFILFVISFFLSSISFAQMKKVGQSGMTYLSISLSARESAMGAAGTNAVPMPNVQEMGSVWSAWNNGISLALTGELPAEESMTEAANQVRDLIQGALAGMVNLPGSYQSLAGCGADWDPACEATAMEETDEGLYTLTVDVPAGEYEYKVAMDGDWGVNYGSDGEQDGPNYALALEEDSTVTFVYDPETHLVETTIE